MFILISCFQKEQILLNTDHIIDIRFHNINYPPLFTKGDVVIHTTEDKEIKLSGNDAKDLWKNATDILLK